MTFSNPSMVNNFHPASFLISYNMGRLQYYLDQMDKIKPHEFLLCFISMSVQCFLVWDVTSYWANSVQLWQSNDSAPAMPDMTKSMLNALAVCPINPLSPTSGNPCFPTSMPQFTILLWLSDEV